MKKFSLIFSIFFVLFLVFFASLSFASNETTYPILPTIDGAKDYQYLIVYDKTNVETCLYLFYSMDNVLELSHTIDNGSLKVYNKSSNAIKYGRYILSNGEWVLSRSFLLSSNSITSLLNPYSHEFLESNFDIYNSDGTFFFQATPQIIQEKSLEEVILESHLAAKEITQETLREELAELIPVGIAILATIILVSLIAYWNFWKP